MGFKFVQLGGRKHTLILTDHYGPMGRPRQGAVVRQKIKIAHTETYCFGNPEPTRNIGGTRQEPWELKGRFSDHWGGPGFALQKKDEVLDFVDDKQPVSIKWDDIIAATGLITEFDPGIESDGEVEWTMAIAIDKNDFWSTPAPDLVKKQPSDHEQDIRAAAKEVADVMLLPLNGDVFDALDSIVSAIGSATASVAQIAGTMQSYEESSIALLRRFRGAIGQLKTATIIFRDTFDALTVDLAIERQNSDDRLRFLSAQSDLSATSLSMLRTIAGADRSAIIAERGQIKSFYTARGGDTWELISRGQYGSDGRAADIRAANNISSGKAPELGSTYQIPL